MASHKQKKDKKRSHKHRRRNRDSFRRHDGKKKIDCKKENIPHDKTAWELVFRDISTYIDNRREMIRQMFSSVGEHFLIDKVPQILQRTTMEELKKICLEELTRMSTEVVFKILEGMPIEIGAKKPLEETYERRKNENKSSSKKSNKHTPRSRSTSRRSHGKRSRDRKRDYSLEEGEIVDLTSEEEDEKQPRCSVDTQSDGGHSGSASVEDLYHGERKEIPSTSFQPIMPKKLAKVAPFNVSVQKPKELVVAAPVTSEEEEDDDVISYEIVDLGLEEEFEVDDDVTKTEVTLTEVLPEVRGINENDSQPVVTEEEMQQNMSEMLELEHRARAIRSMLANIDKLQV